MSGGCVGSGRLWAALARAGRCVLRVCDEREAIHAIMVPGLAKEKE